MNTIKNTQPKRQSEPTCASCDHLSFAGHYCHNWQCVVDYLDSTCNSHTRIKAPARR